MASVGLPPPPINDSPGSFTWLEWYRQLRSYISTSGSVPWYVVDFAGSNITDIATRLHNSLQSLQGGTSGEMYHLTAAQYSALTAGPHNSLSGLQGGTASEYYHLTSAEQTALASSVNGTWTPTFTNLTVVNGTGGATYTGRYSRIGRTVFYTINIVCTGTATTAATGTTYCTIPIAASYDDIVHHKLIPGGGPGGGGNHDTGYLDSTNDRCYPSSWTATDNTIIISGKYEV
jgi:hypothetical protein